jgi:hypothetical protein
MFIADPKKPENKITNTFIFSYVYESGWSNCG